MGARFSRAGLFGALMLLGGACSSKTTAHGTERDDAGHGGTMGSGGAGGATAGTGGSRPDGSSGTGGSGGVGGSAGGTAGDAAGGAAGGDSGGKPTLDCDAFAKAQCNQLNTCAKF